MAEEKVPNKYDDPYWTNLASITESQLKLPEGLLVSILTKGEKTNNDRVSEAGAKTPFQIIPATQKAAIKKYGIDPYLSPKNAAKVAGLLLKDSLARNNNDTRLAVAEYHGGTNKANWGPRTKAYVNRVTGEATPATSGVSEVDINNEADIDQVLADFDKWSKDSQAQVDEKINSQNNPQGTVASEAPTEAKSEQESFDDELLNRFDNHVKQNTVSKEFLKLYNSDKMPPGQKRSFEEGVAKGDYVLPKGETIGKTQEPGFIDKMIGGGEATLSVLTGGVSGFVGGAWDRAAAVAADLGGDKSESKRIMEEQPATNLALDKFSYHPITESGQDYIGGVAKFAENLPMTPVTAEFAGMGTLAKGVGNVAKANIINKVAPVISKAGGAIDEAVSAVKPVNPAAVAVERAVAPVAKGAALAEAPTGTVVRQAEVPAANLLNASELGAVAKKAGTGDKVATAKLVAQAKPDLKLLEAAKKLGFEEDLAPEHLTKNTTFKELAEVLSKVPESQIKAKSADSLKRISKSADDVIKKLGGDSDLSKLDEDLKSTLKNTEERLKGSAGAIYDEIRAKVPANTPTPATNVLNFVNQRLKDFKGDSNLLTDGEKGILKSLSPKQSERPAIVIPESNRLDRFQSRELFSQKEPVMEQASYAALDKIRKDIGFARRKGEGPFGTLDSKLLGELESALRKDQGEVVARPEFGMGEKWEVANTLTKQYKGLQENLQALFDESLTGSVVPKIGSAVRSLPTGDASKFVNLVKHVPKELRQEFTASALSKALGKSGELDFKSFANWYEGLLNNKKSYTAIMTNLPKEARSQLNALYRLSKAISTEGTQTGKNQIKAAFAPANNLMSKVFDVAQRVGIGRAIATTAAAASFGRANVGLTAALTSAFMKGKTSALKAADELIASDAFLDTVKQAPINPVKASKKLSISLPFKKFANSVKLPKLENKEDWILQALQAENVQSKAQQNKDDSE